MAEDIRQKIFHKSRELWRQKKRESKKQVGKYFQIFNYFLYFQGKRGDKKREKQVGKYFQIFKYIVIFSRKTWRRKKRESKKLVGKHFQTEENLVETTLCV